MKIKILIVDDEVQITQMLENYFSLEGYEVASANDPLVALQMIEKENYNIVITDIKMPNMNGLDLLKEIKKYNGLIQVIVITGYVTMDNILAAFRRGAVNCFFKPFENLDMLKHEVQLAVTRLARVQEVLKKLHDMKHEQSHVDAQEA